MQTFLIRSKASHRKIRLYAVACCRTISHLLTHEEVRKALEAAERYAEGRIGDQMALQWYRRALRSRPGLADPSVQWTPEFIAAGAVSTTLSRIHPPFGLQTHFEVARALVATKSKKPGNSLAVKLAMSPLCHLLRDIFGNPFRNVNLDPRWLNSKVVNLAHAIYDERDFDGMPIWPMP
jgi:hypothetical protein